jgi:hypothetical protein
MTAAKGPVPSLLFRLPLAPQDTPPLLTDMHQPSSPGLLGSRQVELLRIQVVGDAAPSLDRVSVSRGHEPGHGPQELPGGEGLRQRRHVVGHSVQLPVADVEHG